MSLDVKGSRYTDSVIKKNGYERFPNTDTSNWSNRCITSHHKICSGKKGECKCPCHLTKRGDC